MLTNLTTRFAALSSGKKGALTAALVGFVDGALVTPNFGGNPVIYMGMPLLGVAAAFAAMGWRRPAGEREPSLLQYVANSALPYVAALLFGTAAHGFYTYTPIELKESRSAPASQSRPKL